jgi:hypothetical protein
MVGSWSVASEGMVKGRDREGRWWPLVGSHQRIKDSGRGVRGRRGTREAE